MLVSFYIIGYIFAFFALFYRTKLLFTAITFAVSAILNVLYILSDGYRSSKFLIRAKKLIDKGELEKAVENIVYSANIQPNEEILVQINASVKKKPEDYGKTAELLSRKFHELDTSFLRFVASSFFYSAHNLQRAKDMLIDVSLEKMTVKAVRLLGSVLYELGDYGRAIKVFSRFDPPHIPMNEDELAIVYGIGICNLAKKETRKAIEFLDRVKAKSPKFGNAGNIIKQLNEESGKG